MLQGDMMDASEIMSAKVKTITPDRSAFDAACIMKKHDIGALPVVDNGKLIGILTESDIFKQVTAKNLMPKKILVKKLMTKKIISVLPTAKIHDVNKLLAEHNIRRVPVVENGKLVGIVSASDLIRQAYHWDS
jgi:CBS domain-containing protein